MTSISFEPSWLTATRESVSLAQSATDSQRQFGDLDNAKRAFSELNAGLKASAEAAVALRGTGWAGSVLSDDVRDRLDEVIARPEARLLAGVPGEITRFNDEVRRSLIDHWRKYAASQIGDVEGLLALIDTLVDVDGVADLAERLNTALGQLVREQDNLPSGDSLTHLKTVREALADLEASLQPESVREFFTGVARGGAAVTSLTKEVAQWLTEHKALDNLKIVAGRPRGSTDG